MTARSKSILLELVSGRGTSRRSRMAEGQARRRFGKDLLENRIGIVQQSLSGNAKRFDTSRSQPIITHDVPLRPIAERVRFSVYLNCQAGIAAEEIKDVWARRVLAAKLQSAGSLPKPPPEYDFGKTHLAPQLPRIARRPRRRSWRSVLQHLRSPSTVLRTVPLPETSSGRICPLRHPSDGPPPPSGEEL